MNNLETWFLAETKIYQKQEEREVFIYNILSLNQETIYAIGTEYDKEKDLKYVYITIYTIIMVRIHIKIISYDKQSNSYWSILTTFRKKRTDNNKYLLFHMYYSLLNWYCYIICNF